MASSTQVGHSIISKSSSSTNPLSKACIDHSKTCDLHAKALKYKAKYTVQVALTKKLQEDIGILQTGINLMQEKGDKLHAEVAQLNGAIDKLQCDNHMLNDRNGRLQRDIQQLVPRIEGNMQLKERVEHFEKQNRGLMMTASNEREGDSSWSVDKAKAIRDKPMQKRTVVGAEGAVAGKKVTIVDDDGVEWELVEPTRAEVALTINQKQE